MKAKGSLWGQKIKETIAAMAKRGALGVAPRRGDVLLPEEQNEEHKEARRIAAEWRARERRLRDNL